MDEGQEEIKAPMCCLASGIEVYQEEMRVRVSAIQYAVKVTIKCSQEEIETKIGANNETFEALGGVVLSRTGIHQARTETIQEEIRVKIRSNQEKIEATKIMVDRNQRRFPRGTLRC
jgi:hypothetical protein